MLLMNCSSSCDRAVKVSVLVTFYNQRDCVDRALNSIFEQEGDCSFEVLVGDDGSTDGTWDVLTEWSNQHPDCIRVFRMSRDNGVDDPIARSSQNRLVLLRNAVGEYVVFLDGDDYFPSPAKLCVQANDLDSCLDIGSSCHNFEYVDEALNRISTPLPVRDSVFDMFFDDFWKSCYLPASCFMFRRPPRDLIAKADESNFDDNTIIFLLTQGGRIRYRGEVMFSYVQKQGSTWSSMDIVHRILANQRDLSYEVSCYPDYRIASYSRHGLELLRLAFVGGDHLAQYESYAKKLGLSEDKRFWPLYHSLTNDGLFASLGSRVHLCLLGTFYGAQKLAAALAFAVRCRFA